MRPSSVVAPQLWALILLGALWVLVSFSSPTDDQCQAGHPYAKFQDVGN